MSANAKNGVSGAMYYTVAEAMEKFNLTRDQLYHYVK